MQALARETNLSETTFILPGDAAAEKERGVRVRIFTVQEELPFAGHPTLGTAFVLRGQSGAQLRVGSISMSGTVPVRFTEALGQPVFRRDDAEESASLARFTTSRRSRRLTDLRAADFDDSAPIQTVSTGVPFTIVPLRSLRTLQNSASISIAPQNIWRGAAGSSSTSFAAKPSIPKARLHARMIFYNGDDPATGSAAGCCSAWMVAHGVAASDEQVLIEQGLEMHRPSSIFVRATKHREA